MNSETERPPRPKLSQYTKKDDSSDVSESRVMSNRTAGLVILAIFLGSIACLVVIFNNFPTMTELVIL